ncbi:MAG TPA: hypothetical protein VK983_03445 [Candidatus Limnocylindrales bacterium]|nr:hypothetical protein [Candidatus Limnocylindrales bacterium]
MDKDPQKRNHYRTRALIVLPSLLLTACMQGGAKEPLPTTTNQPVPTTSPEAATQRVVCDPLTPDDKSILIPKRRSDPLRVIDRLGLPASTKTSDLLFAAARCGNRITPGSAALEDIQVEVTKYERLDCLAIDDLPQNPGSEFKPGDVIVGCYLPEPARSSAPEGNFV